MKKIQHWIMILLLLMPSVLFQSLVLLHNELWYSYVQYTYIRSKHSTQYITLSFHTSELSKLKWHKPHEFEWNNKMYDIKSVNQETDSIHYLVWEDEHESRVYKGVSNIQEMQNALTRNEILHWRYLFLFSHPVFLHEIQEKLNSDTGILTFEFFFLQEVFLLTYLEIPIPPPKTV